jgi:hypothetical protein
MSTPITWNNADFTWNNNTYKWDEVQLIQQLIRGGGDFSEEIYKYNAPKKRKLIKLILKVYGNTITESKKREIKQYKIKAKDIKIAVKEVLGVEMIAENISI